MQTPRQRPPVVWNLPDRPEIPNVAHHVLRSAAMDRDMGYNVYTPPGYDPKARRRYPVVYFLHGAGGNENSDAGGFSSLLSRLVGSGAIPPVLCVFPNGGMSGYADHPSRKERVETFLMRELIPEIDRAYRTQAHRDGRRVCGFSMGGGGAVRLALKYPDRFSAAAGWAAALKGFGETDDPSDLARRNARRIRGRVALLLIVGDKDLTFASHAPVLKTLEELEIPVTYRELPGVEHNLGVYYQQTGEELARFVGQERSAPR